MVQTKGGVVIGPERAKRRRAIARRMMAAAKLDKDWSLQPKNLLDMVRQAQSLSVRLKKQRAEEQRLLEEQAKMNSVPAWKRDAIKAKLRAEEKRRLAKMTKAERTRILKAEKEAELSKKKAAEVRMRTIRKQSEGEREDMSAALRVGQEKAQQQTDLQEHQRIQAILGAPTSPEAAGYTKTGQRIDPERRARRKAIAKRMMAAAKLDKDWKLKPKGPRLQFLAANAASLKQRVAQQQERDAAQAKEMAAKANLPAWKRDALEAKERAEAQRQRAKLSLSERRALDKAEKEAAALKKKSDAVRLKTILRQAESEQADFLWSMSLAGSKREAELKAQTEAVVAKEAETRARQKEAEQAEKARVRAEEEQRRLEEAESPPPSPPPVERRRGLASAGGKKRGMRVVSAEFAEPQKWHWTDPAPPLYYQVCGTP